MKVVLAPVGTRGCSAASGVGGGAVAGRAWGDVLCGRELCPVGAGDRPELCPRRSRAGDADSRARREPGRPFAGARASRMVLDEQLELVRPACQGADILVGTSVLLMGPSIAAGLRIPLLHGLHSELFADRGTSATVWFPAVAASLAESLAVAAYGLGRKPDDASPHQPLARSAFAAGRR